LKYRLISIFWLHRTAEGVSANTVAILPGGTEALSGGDDGQVRRQGNIFKLVTPKKRQRARAG